MSFHTIKTVKKYYKYDRFSKTVKYKHFLMSIKYYVCFNEQNHRKYEKTLFWFMTLRLKT